MGFLRPKPWDLVPITLTISILLGYPSYWVYRVLFLILVFLMHCFFNLKILRNPREKWKYTLVSIPISHYVEKVRWALDRLEVDYNEYKCIGIFGTLLDARTVPVLEYGRTSIGDSKEILAYLRGAYPEKGKFLQIEDEKYLALMEKLDTLFAQHLRRFLYNIFVNDPRYSNDMIYMWSHGVTPVYKAILPYVYPIAIKLLVFLLNINDKAAMRSKEKFEAILDEMDELLSDGRKFIMGDEFSILDIAFCSLGAPLILPEEGKASMIRFDKLYPEHQEMISGYRKRPSGQFILRIFKEYR